MKATMVDVWYSRSDKSWIVQVKDAEGNQIGDADYVYTKPEAMNLKKQYEAAIATDEAPVTQPDRETGGEQ